MYAIIRTGGKQTKVREGDVIDVEHLRAEGEVSFTPLLVVDDAGTVFSHRDMLREARVVTRVMGESAGPKVDLFKYKSKTGYRRHMGHRQRYTTLEVTRIDAPEGAKRSPEGAKQAKAPARAAKRAPVGAAPAPQAEKAPAAKAVPKGAAKAAPKTAHKPASKPAPKAAPRKPATPKPPAAAKAPAKKKKES